MQILVLRGYWGTFAAVVERPLHCEFECLNLHLLVNVERWADVHRSNADSGCLERRCRRRNPGCTALTTMYIYTEPLQSRYSACNGAAKALVALSPTQCQLHNRNQAVATMKWRCAATVLPDQRAHCHRHVYSPSG